MKLNEPIKVGNLTFKNRVMFPPLTTGYEERDGSIGPRSLAFYERLKVVQLISLLEMLRQSEQLRQHQNSMILHRFQHLRLWLMPCTDMMLNWLYRYSILNMMFQVLAD